MFFPNRIALFLHPRAHVDQPPFLTQRRKGAKTQRPPTRPRRKHEGTKTLRIHEDANPRFLTQRPPNDPYCPQITQIDPDAFDLNWVVQLYRQIYLPYPLKNAEAQRRRDAEETSQNSSVWRGSGRRTAGNRWAGPPLRIQVFISVSRPSGLRSGSASLATSLLHSIDGRVTSPSQR